MVRVRDQGGDDAGIQRREEVVLEVDDQEARFHVADRYGLGTTDM